MTKAIRFGSLAVAVLAIVAWASPASAKCGVNKDMGNYPSTGSCGYYCQMVDPGVGIGSVQGNYWVIGAGINDPPRATCNTPGTGTDNGNYQADGTCGTAGWLAVAGTNQYNIGFGTDTGNTDSCPLNGQKVAIAFYDKSADGQHAYFGALVADVQDSRTPVVDWGTAGVLTMKELPKPTITASTHTGNTRNVTMTWTIPPGICLEGANSAGTCATVISGWDVYKRERPRSDATPDNVRGVGSWQLVGNAAGGATNTTTVNFACSTQLNTVAQLALVPHLDSGFVPNFVGAGSTRVECDPNIATPGGQFKIIDKKVGGAKSQVN